MVRLRAVMHPSLHQLLRDLEPSFLRGEVRRIAGKHWRRWRGLDQRVVTLEPTVGDGPAHGRRALLSYILDPFLLPPEAEIPHSHTHFWETRTLARALGGVGYTVEAISWTNHHYRPSHPIDLLIDVRLNLERLAPELGGAVKVLHADTAHHSFHNPAQEQRRAELEARRGVRIRPQKMLPENRAAELADLISVLGNGFTQGTYAFAGKPMVHLPVSVPLAYPWPEGKDFEAVRRRFLWFGSGGLVHKGLDLVLEAFAGLDDHHLTICGPVRAERDFERTYERELYRTPNIETRGWVDVAGPEFTALARQTLALVYPSCSEGGGSSALTCMHAALVPVLQREVSVDLEPERGVLLDDVSVEGLRRAIVELSDRPVGQLETMARSAWSFARQHHTRQVFEEQAGRFAELLASGAWRDLPPGEMAHEL